MTFSAEKKDLTPRQKESLDTSVDVALVAGAGSGKTKVLVERYIEILRADPALMPENILALTFTEKASAEMRDKIRDELCSIADSEGGRWEMVLEGLDTADISTIHSFCAKLVRSDPLQCGLDPDFRVLSETEMSVVLTDVINSMLKETGPESLSLRRLIVDHSMNSVVKMLKGLARDRAKMSLDMSSDEFRASSLRFLDGSYSEALEAAVRELHDIIPCLKALHGLKVPPFVDSGTRVMNGLKRVLDLASKINAAPSRVEELALMAELSKARAVLLNTKGTARSAGGLGNSRFWRSDLGALRENMAQVFSYENRHSNTLLFVERGDLMDRARERLTDLISVLSSFLSRLAAEKRRRNGLDFDDMVDMAVGMVRSDRNGAAEKLRSRLRHIMIDEFQDTDDRQWRIAEALWNGGRDCRLFIVGDPKQSIYGFRSADVRLFSKVSDMVRSGAKGKGFALDRNFRSSKEIMDFVNAVFPSVMGEDGGGWGVPFDPLDAHKGPGGSVSVVAVVGKRGAEAREGAFAASHILRSVGSLTVEDDKGRRPLRFGDIAVLLPTRKGIKYYEEALRGASVPFTVYKGKGFFERQEVSDILSLTSFLSNPTDDIALASVLKGPFFVLSDEDLFAIPGTGGTTLFERMGKHPPLVNAHGRLLRSIELSSMLPPFISVPMIMDILCAHSALKGRRGSRNLDKLLDWVRSEDTMRTLGEMRDSLYRFVEEPPPEGEANVAFEKDTVSLLTVHAAKGLEWPMVMVLGMQHEGRPKNASPYQLSQDRGLALTVSDDMSGRSVHTTSWSKALEDQERKDMEESKRLFYVACTRAKDHLVLSGMLPIGQNGQEEEPRAMMRLLREHMPLAYEDLKAGSKDIGGVKVLIHAVEGDDAVVMEAEEEADKEGPNLTEEGSSIGVMMVGPPPSSPPVPFLAPTDGRITGPVMEEMGLARAGPGPKGEERSLPGTVDPRQFGECVHEIMEGRVPERVLREHGMMSVRDEVMDRVSAMKARLSALDIEREWRELELCVPMEIKDLGRVIVRGRLDLLVRSRDGSYTVIDYKTGELRPEYLAQMEIYRRMVSKVFKGPVGTMLLGS